MEISKGEFIEYLNEYIERDKSLLKEYGATIKKIDNSEMIIWLEEVKRVSDNLTKYIQLKESTEKCQSKMTFIYDEETGQPMRIFDIKGQVQNKLHKRLEKERQQQTSTEAGYFG